jgi:sporulation protein YlmC with PRC-barrel domain
MDTEIRPNALSVASLLGKPIVSPHGEFFGTLEEMMLDVESGCIAYVVITVEGVDGQLYAVPWEALTLSSDQQRYVIHVDRARLLNAPGFERDAWPDVTYDYLGEIYAYYGLEPYWEDDEFEASAYDYDDDFGFLDGEEN